MEFVVTTVAKAATNELEESTFLFCEQRWVKLIEWVDFDKLLYLKQSGFFLRQHTINESEHLLLCHSNALINQHFACDYNDKNLLLKAFFEDCDEDSKPLEQWLSTATEGRGLSLDGFYEHLRLAHVDDDLESNVNIPKDVQHEDLKPTLRPYQQRGIKWMLKRELGVDKLSSYCIKIRSKVNASQVFYYNKFSEEILLEPSPPIVIPTGGLLTDEMGLGKTVEVICLMLMNPRQTGIKRKADMLENGESITAAQPSSYSEVQSVKCICKDSKSKKKMIFVHCTLCKSSQHLKCMFQGETTQADLESYLCHNCWKTTGRMVDAPTTLIITPASIKHQWKQEIAMHINEHSGFKTLVYNGVSSHSFISPSEIAKYNVVITDFQTLSKELYFSDSSTRSFRQEKKYHSPASPLNQIKWWRVVVDEAQIVESTQTRPSSFINKISSVHRWGTTGTPIEKDSIHCLYGLLYYLNYKPFTYERLFNHMWRKYREGQHDEMISVLSKVMWRTCKKNVLHEINIPEQSEVFHEVEMTDLQHYFYRKVHLATIPLFSKNVHDYLLRNGPFEFVFKHMMRVRQRKIDLTMKDKFLSELNNATLKIFLEPLRRLRQDCTIPSIFQNNGNDQSRVKQTLKPTELHAHLVSEALLETKSQLRTIVSSTNGIAALKIAQEKYDEAIQQYKQVLKTAEDYTGPVHVDTMLQIHAYYGLVEIATITDNEGELKNKETYTTEMYKLEWKYVNNYYNKVKAINVEMEKLQPELKDASKEVDVTGGWWRHIINSQRTADDMNRMMEAINTEVFSSIVNHSQITEQLQSVRGINLIVTEWSDKIQKFSKLVNKHFGDFNFIVHNLRPLNEMSGNDTAKVLRLAKAALNCHLNLFDEGEDENSARRTNKKGNCDLCKLKLTLNEYECVLFNKSIVDDNVEGTWNPRLEENLLKAMHKHAKRCRYDDETIESGDSFFKYLEALKKQFQIYAKLWVEVNYTISAFDELNMCKMRMQVVESPDEITEEDKRYRLKIPFYEMDGHMELLLGQKKEAELKFVRMNGRLKYLKHLEEQNEVQPCPICTLLPKERYFVTACGHTVCAECFHQLIKSRARVIKCPVCRSEQQTKNIYAVTCSDMNSEEPITGSYSPKIDEIVRSVLRLQKDEPDVKVLMFSHWDSMLEAIATGLEANNITYRSSYKANFPKQIQDFKDLDKKVTCMMINLKFGGKGLNLTEATHCFLVEPILNADEELQAIGRIHRIGQTRHTFLHRFITNKTIEETMSNKILQQKEKWMRKEFTISDLEELLNVNEDLLDVNEEMLSLSGISQ